MFKNALLLGLAMLLWSCNTPQSYGPETPYFRFPAGTRLVLNHPLEIPANWATARLQYGKVHAFGHVHEQEPHCIFEINTVSVESQRVEPDIFIVTDVRRSVSEIAVFPGFFIRSAFADDDAPIPIFYKTTFWLRSDRQPGVRSLVCQVGPYSSDFMRLQHLTVMEIRQALGSIFTLEMPASQGS